MPSEPAPWWRLMLTLGYLFNRLVVVLYFSLTSVLHEILPVQDRQLLALFFELRTMGSLSSLPFVNCDLLGQAIEWVVALDFKELAFPGYFKRLQLILLLFHNLALVLKHQHVESLHPSEHGSSFELSVERSQNELFLSAIAAIWHTPHY